ncbi:MAG: molybdopterin synthase [Halobacteriales archaeon]
MRPLGIAASPPDSGTLMDEISNFLSSKGSLAVISPLPVGDVKKQNFSAYQLDEKGNWSASGSNMTLTTLFDIIATEHDYALVGGFENANIPYIVLNEHSHSGTTLMELDSAENLDVNQLLRNLQTTEPFETLDSLIARAVKSPNANQAGAIATFTGRVRELDYPSDSPTTRLEFEKYAGVAESRLQQICSELCQRDGIFEVLMHHRVGPIESGENVVFVVVLGAHRDEAFKTVQDGINRLKNEVPIFKKEIKIDGSFWVHDRP